MRWNLQKLLLLNLVCIDDRFLRTFVSEGSITQFICGTAITFLQENTNQYWPLYCGYYNSHRLMLKDLKDPSPQDYLITTTRHSKLAVFYLVIIAFSMLEWFATRWNPSRTLSQLVLQRVNICEANINSRGIFGKRLYVPSCFTTEEHCTLYFSCDLHRSEVVTENSFKVAMHSWCPPSHLCCNIFWERKLLYNIAAVMRFAAWVQLYTLRSSERNPGDTVIIVQRCKDALGTMELLDFQWSHSGMNFHNCRTRHQILIS